MELAVAGQQQGAEARCVRACSRACAGLCFGGKHRLDPGHLRFLGQLPAVVSWTCGSPQA